MKQNYLTNNAAETKKIGKVLAKKLLKTKSRKRAIVIGLEGDLGGGKTTFLQGLAKGLGIREKILSPTFVIMKRFEIHDSLFKSFYHIDCYRIERSKEILNLGFKEIISEPKNIVCIEWSDRIKNILPKDTLRVKFEFIDKKTRKITFYD